MKHFSWACLLCAGLGLWQAARAEDPPARPQAAAASAPPPPIRLRLHPAPAPRAALRYRLLPPIWELRHGNAAVMYSKRVINLQGKAFEDLQQQLDTWLELPAAELPREEIRAALAGWSDLFVDVDLAARRTSCDWELPLGERNLITLTLPELQGCRSIARLLAVRARLQVADGKLDEALRTFHTGFALAQHVAQGPTLINCLVGMAISQTLFQALRDLMQHADAPNLYWALTTLPQPLIDLRKAMEFESSMLYLSFPDLLAIQTGDRPPRDWQATIDKLVTELQPMLGSDGAPSNRLALTVVAVCAYPQAKQRLLERGRDAAQIEAMPVFEVLVRDSLSTYEELRDQNLCWFYVPYSQGRARMEAAEKYLLTAGRQREAIPLASQLVPAIRNVSLSAARADRQVAVLRAIEALRLHAVDHDGRWPQRLADVDVVPVPDDPLSGQPFEYAVHDGIATISTPATADPREATAALRFDLQAVK